MVLKLFKDKTALAAAAAEQAGTSIRHAIAEHGKARIIAATGASQFEFLEALTSLPGIDWKQVEMFHLDEYIGLPASHPASFSNYLQQRLIQKTGITQHYLLDGDGDPAGVIGRTSQALRQAPVDVAFVGVGENGHLAFNDPPADFETEEEYLIVTLDEACRRQQLGEGWFATLDDVPRRAISMSVRQILKAKRILCIVHHGVSRSTFGGALRSYSPKVGFVTNETIPEIHNAGKGAADARIDLYKLTLLILPFA